MAFMAPVPDRLRDGPAVQVAPKASAPRRSWRLLPARDVDRIKRVLLFAFLLPLARLVAAGVADANGWAAGNWLTLGTNPIETVTRSTGTWALAFLCLTLLVTPLRRLTGANWLLRVRRVIGLYAFFYAVLHLVTYVWFDQWFDWTAIAKDVVKRPFITAGFAALVLLVPLALTSTDRMIRRLGRHWSRLHTLVYVIAPLGAIHYWWLVKRDLTQPALWTAAIALLLGFRVVWRLRESAAPSPPATGDGRRAGAG